MLNPLMNRLLSIVFIIFMFPTVHIYAQDKGNVSVHTDPRLSLLLSRTKIAETPSAAGNYEPAKEPVRKGKTKPAANTGETGQSRQSRNNTSLAVLTKEKEPLRQAKAIYNPEGDIPPVEKANKVRVSSTTTIDDQQARIAYARSKSLEKDEVTNEKSSAEEIRAYRENIESERSGKQPSKKTSRPGIAADEVRYLTQTVSGTSRGGRYNGTGFRVQIYYGTSRLEAMKRKAEFMRHYPGVPTYFSYATPTYRVKVGDYRRREDAISMFREANGTYSPCMIVPDVVAIH